ncbi:WGR domain-containing protein [Thiolapillus sp.]|uniref:WGR domain-containing protein n=3 Tax=Thiolapillus sp. TaxID=2017437 RepID=UPI0034D470E2
MEYIRKWRWHHELKDRYYTAAAEVDLFGRWTLLDSWGGRHNRLGGGKTETYDSWKALVRAVDALNRQRVKRGYVLSTMQPRRTTIAPHGAPNPGGSPSALPSNPEIIHRNCG